MIINPVKLFLLTLGLFLSGCALSSARPFFLTRESASAKKLIVPVVRQSDVNMCGVAALQMIENFYQAPVQAQSHKNLVESVNASKGTSGAALKDAFINSGYSAVIFPGDLSNGITGLYHHIDNGHPVIVMIGAENQRHYLVAFGYDPENQKIYFNDPLKGAVAYSSESFLKFWQPANNFSLLVFPKP